MQLHLNPLKHCCKLFYVSLYIALCSTESQWPISVKVQERNIIIIKKVKIPSYQSINENVYKLRKNIFD